MIDNLSMYLSFLFVEKKKTRKVENCSVDVQIKFFKEFFTEEKNFITIFLIKHFLNLKMKGVKRKVFFFLNQKI